MRTYSISVLATKNDDGFALSFTSREQADEARTALLAEGVYHVSQVW